ncbi:MAG: RagB/SusD family nutrient uptake outer membrane protein, partial [Rhodothermales bacterium]|nr:RagB/SusD family nutrient uptake outer membrane protein [Rhodothermales bacterium]
RANTVIEAINNAQTEISNKDQLLAELRFLRAFYYFQLLDFFGNVPIVEEAVVDSDNPPATNSRAEVFAYVEDELIFAAGALPPQSEWGAANFGRATSGAANALLARLYLNAEILAGTTTASGIDKAAGRWSDAASRADAVIGSGEYGLTDDYLDNFRVDNHTSPELIFVTPTLAKGGLGLTFIMRTLHYNQIPQTPWNGFIVLADVFNQFDPDDRRADVFLVGQMYSQPNQGCIGNECFSDTTSPALEDRQGNPLAFTPGLFTPAGTPVTSGEPINIDETSGVRVVKWEIDPSRAGGDNGNDYAWFRLGEMYLIKAEAAFRQSNNGEALTNLNVLRERAFGNSDNNLGSVNADVLLQERQFELLWEAVRRQDLIRFDRFTSGTWAFKTNTEAHHNVFPVPQVQLDANPNLEQNPGY